MTDKEIILQEYNNLRTALCNHLYQGPTVIGLDSNNSITELMVIPDEHDQVGRSEIKLAMDYLKQQGVHGILFTTNAWMLKTPVNTKVEEIKLPIHDHPDKIESAVVVYSRPNGTQVIATGEVHRVNRVITVDDPDMEMLDSQLECTNPDDYACSGSLHPNSWKETDNAKQHGKEGQQKGGTGETLPSPHTLQ